MPQLPLQRTYNQQLPIQIQMLPALAVANITNIYLAVPTKFKLFQTLSRRNLADPSGIMPGRIDILLDANMFSSLMAPGFIRRPPCVINTPTKQVRMGSP